MWLPLVTSYPLQLVLCENNVYSQGHMNDTLTHELVHAYDHCRAKVDWDKLEHLACSEVRAANLSGECFFWKETFARLKFGWRKHHQVWPAMEGAELTSPICYIGVCKGESHQVCAVCERHQ